MTETEDTPRAGGGPLRTRGVPPRMSTEGPALMPDLGARRADRPLSMGDERERPNATYLYQARSPLLYLAAGIVALGGVSIMLSWISGFERDRSPGNLWFYTFSLLAPLEDLASSRDAWSNRAVVAVAIAAALILLIWVGRIGRNVRSFGFGFFLGLAALPAWYMLPMIIGQEQGLERSYGVFIMRTAFALVILVAQYGLVRATLLRRMWAAGGLPEPAVSTVLWLPALIPLAMLFGSTLFTLIAVGEDRTGTSSWVPTDTMRDAAVHHTGSAPVWRRVVVLV